MGEAVLNYPVQRIIPQNGTYAFYDRGGHELITLPDEAVYKMIEKHDEILEDLKNENLTRTEYWQSDKIIIYSMRQPNENANPTPVVCIEKDDQIEVVLKLEACDLMIRMAKIIRHHEQNDRINIYSLPIKTQKRLDIDIRGNRLTIVDEVHDERAVTFPLMVLAYLWKCYGDIHRELTEEHFNETTFWSDFNLTIRRMRLRNELVDGYWNVLTFQRLLFSNSPKLIYLSIILRTFKEMLQETAGHYFTDEAPSDESDEDGAAGHLSQDKTFQFPVPDLPNHFRIKNEYNKYYNLLTAALDVAIQNIDEINNYLQGYGGDMKKKYWFDENYVMCTFAHENKPRGIDVRTIKFIRRKDCFLLVAYTAESFARILEEYQENMKTEVTEPTMPPSFEKKAITFDRN